MARGLGHYYDLQKRNSFRRPRPAPAPRLVEDPPPSLDDNRGQMRFHLEGVHCLGCLWVLEKLSEIEPRILSARLDMAHDILEVNIKPGSISWGEVIGWIRRLGYSARALDETVASGEKYRREDISQLTRLAVAAFGTGNIMLLTVSIYAGSDPFWSRNFAWLSFLLAAPVLTYSAWPLYRSAFLPLLHKRVSIDLAICLAILAGVSMSLWNLSKGSTNAIYFDSLSMLVFLLLASRVALNRMRHSLAQRTPCLSFLATERFSKMAGEVATLVSAADFAAGDILQLRRGQTLPVDGILLSPEPATFDLSLLTGEIAPMEFLPGDRIEAGSRLESQDIRLRTLSPAGQSRLAKILDQIHAYELHRSPTVEFADRIGRRFVVAVLGLCLLLLLWMPTEEGLKRALALAIVTCPCVLAFAIPLTLTRALQKAARLGILFRDSATLELLAGTENIFFDKTGTLTDGAFKVLDWVPVSGPLEEARAAAFALESKSGHPIAKAITRDAPSRFAPQPVTEFRDVPGGGVEGWINGSKWRVQASPRAAVYGVNRVGVWCGEELKAEVVLGDRLRDEAHHVVKECGQLGLRCHLVSGDRAINAAAVADNLKLETWHAELKPEQKASLVKAYRHTLMIGDGANDAVAFRAADVSMAMQGAVDLSLRHSDILLTRPGLVSLLRALRLSRKTVSLVRTNFAFTLTYNVIAGTLALCGLMSPLLAAVIMPSSALTVFLYTNWRFQREDFS